MTGSNNTFKSFNDLASKVYKVLVFFVCSLSTDWVNLDIFWSRNCDIEKKNYSKLIFWFNQHQKTAMVIINNLISAFIMTLLHLFCLYNEIQTSAVLWHPPLPSLPPWSLHPVSLSFITKTIFSRIYTNSNHMCPDNSRSFNSPWSFKVKLQQKQYLYNLAYKSLYCFSICLSVGGYNSITVGKLLSRQSKETSAIYLSYLSLYPKALHITNHAPYEFAHQ